MPPEYQFRAPVPFFVPAISVAVILTVLFLVGLSEQENLVDSRVEQVLRQHESYAHLVADDMERSLLDAEKSAVRYADLLTQALTQTPPDPPAAHDFANQLETGKDGALRNKRAAFNSHEQAGIWIPATLKTDPAVLQLFRVMAPVTQIYGQGARSAPFVNTWVLPKQGGELIYWPDDPDFVFKASSNVDFSNTPWVQLSDPRTNPHKQPRWTHLSFDPVAGLWMTSVVAPVFRGDEWVASAGHDLPLDSLLQQAHLLGQSPESFFVLATADGHIVASDRFADAIKSGNGELTLAQLQDEVLDKARLLSASRLHDNPFQRLRVAGNEVFVTRIQPQDWVLTNVIPLQPITAGIEASFNRLRNIALAVLVAELVIATLLLALSHFRAQRQYNKLAAVQDQLIRSERYHRTLVDNIPGIVYRCHKNADWSMLFISPVVEQFTGYPAADFIENRKLHFASVIHPDDRQNTETIVENAMARDKPYVLEYRILHKSGTVRWVLEHGRAVERNPEDEVELEGVILDITALKQAEQELRKLNDSLEEQVDARTVELRNAVRDLETFNYAVSHDLKAPVRQVTGFLDAIADDLPADTGSDIRDLIRRSQNALTRMKEMIASLHAYSLLKRESVSLAPVNINDLLTYIVEKLPKSVRERIKLDIPPIDNVQADRTLMRIVLHHLLDNAIKFTAHVEHPQITLVDHSTSVEWMLEVRDNGAGFNPEYHDAMFQMFQRLHSQDAFPGFGVGLALVHKILSLHGGKVWAESGPEKGASFFISIPVKAIRHGPKAVSVSHAAR